MGEMTEIDAGGGRRPPPDPRPDQDGRARAGRAARCRARPRGGLRREPRDPAGGARRARVRGLMRRVLGAAAARSSRDQKVERDLTSLQGVPAYRGAQGFAAGTRVLATAMRAARGRTRAALRLADGALVLEVVRIRLADGAPISLERARFPADRFAGLLDHPLGGSLYELLGEVYGSRRARRRSGSRSSARPPPTRARWACAAMRRSSRSRAPRTTPWACRSSTRTTSSRRPHAHRRAHPGRRGRRASRARGRRGRRGLRGADRRASRRAAAPRADVTIRARCGVATVNHALATPRPR